MISIPGSIGKHSSIISFLLEEGENADNSSRKRRLDGTYENSMDKTVQFPVSTAEFEYSLLQDIWRASKNTLDELDIQWHFQKLSDTTTASMKVYKNQACLVENEQLLMTNTFNENTIRAFEETNQLFTAIVFASYHQLISVSFAKLVLSSDHTFGLTLLLEFTVHLNTVKRSNYVNLMSALSQIIPLESEDDTVVSKKKKSRVVTTLDTNASSSSSSSSMDLVPMNEQSTTITSYKPKSKPMPSIPTDVSLEAFFNNLQPPVSDQLLEHYVAPTILAQLTPFQTQNIEWMMQREGHFVTKSGETKPISNKPCPLLHSYDKNTDQYINLFSGSIVSDKKEIKRLTETSLQGGILADEMGLGKTLCILGLIAKHKWNKHDKSHPNPNDFPKLIFSKGTLVIVPGSIMSQWAAEAKRHAPGLTVYEYKGATDETISNEELATYDIVLVHYEKFRSEISHSKPPPPRPRRHATKYKFRLSPLVSVLWFRCILDEAQMVESLKTRTATMAQRIPRWYSWAVTGTPTKTSYNDLFGLYKYLELEETVSNSYKDFHALHHHLQYKGVFFDFVKATMRRNMKSALTNQVFIPKQTRHVVHIPLSTIEQHYYEDIWEKCKQHLQLDWLDSMGWQLPDDASEESKQLLHNLKLGMRPLLLALRQSCIHPSLVANTLVRLGHTVGGTTGNNNTSANQRILSMSDVLYDMARDAKTKYTAKQLAYYTMQLRHAGMYEVMELWQNAADIYLENLPPVEALVKLLVEEMETIQSEKKVSKGIAEDEEEKKKNLLSILALTTNRWSLLLHQYCFYLGGIFHALGKEELERMYYQQAADVRRSLLEKHATKVQSALRELNSAGVNIKLNEGDQLGRREVDEQILKFKNHEEKEDAEEEDEVDPRNEDITMVKNLKQIGEILDTQYAKMTYLREKAIAILSKPLVDSDSSEDVTGDEYENSVNDQAMCQVYISAYQALLQDRKFIVKGVVTSLFDSPSSDYEVMSSEAKEVEAVESKFRKSLRSPGFQVQCLKDIEFFLRNLRGCIKKNNSSELAMMVYENHDWIKSILPRESKMVDYLEQDIKKLSQLFNNRIAYYKSLQTISDTLLDWKHSDPDEEIERIVSESTKLEEEIDTCKSRNSYFQALVEEHEKLKLTGKGNTRKDCLICLNPIEKGMITYCGHTSCFNCGIRWFKAHRRCHTCNANVNRNEWYKISYREAEMHDRDAPRHHPIASSKKASEKANASYERQRNQGQLQEIIQQINAESIIEGQGAKLDRIIRHIKFIKNDTNGKCVVFSQWTKVLDMLRIGLTANGINCVTLTAGVNKANVTKFQEDPSINVILLHARSQSSGLTLVAAQTVFIVEPVFNETLERQAINRVHRIGQKKQTSVFWYIAQDTVEERIQLIHDRERNRKIRTGTDGIEDNLTLTSHTDGGGEWVNDNELRSCFTSVQAYI